MPHAGPQCLPRQLEDAASGPRDPGVLSWCCTNVLLFPEQSCLLSCQRGPPLIPQNTPGLGGECADMSKVRKLKFFRQFNQFLPLLSFCTLVTREMEGENAKTCNTVLSDTHYTEK